jgi:hypothetical protein
VKTGRSVYTDLDCTLRWEFGYPCVASFDLLHNLRTYTADSSKIALYCAPMLVLMEAKLVMVVLFASLQPWESRRRLDIIFVSAALCYFCIIHQVSLLVCLDKFLLFAPNFSHIPLRPWIGKEGATDINTCQQNLNNYISKGTNAERTVWASTGDEEHEHLMRILGIPCALYLMLGWPRKTPLMLVFNAVIGTFMWAIIWAFLGLASELLFWPIMILMDIPDWHTGTRLIPQSAVSFLDLDQIAAFVVGGLVPLVISVAPVIRGIYERYWASSNS